MAKPAVGKLLLPQHYHFPALQQRKPELFSLVALLACVNPCLFVLSYFNRHMEFEITQAYKLCA